MQKSRWFRKSTIIAHFGWNWASLLVSDVSMVGGVEPRLVLYRQYVQKTFIILDEPAQPNLEINQTTARLG